MVNISTFLILLLFSLTTANSVARSIDSVQGYQLVGMIRLGHDGIAVVRHEQSQRTFMLRPGDKIPGADIEVLSLNNKEVVLRAGQVQQVLAYSGSRMVSQQENGQERYPDQFKLASEGIIDPEEIEMKTNEYFENQDWLDGIGREAPVRQRRAVVTMEEYQFPHRKTHKQNLEDGQSESDYWDDDSAESVLPGDEEQW